MLLRDDQRESSAHARGFSWAPAGSWLPSVHLLPVSECSSSPALTLAPDWRDGSPLPRGSEYTDSDRSDVRRLDRLALS